MKKIFIKFLLIFIVMLSCFILGVYVFLHHPKFGKNPFGEHLEQLQQSTNFHNGEFQNTIPTSTLIEGATTLSIIWSDFWVEKAQTTPFSDIPTIKTNLHTLSKSRDVAIWLGHSSYFIQLNEQRILIDPVLSNYASPLSFINKAFNGTSIYTAEDIPEIDYLLISHDHWDHLDYPTITQLSNKVRQVITPLGVGSHLEYWGYPSENIHEADWQTSLQADSELTIYILPARHYSGRLFNKNKTLWAAFALQTPQHKLFFSGDSGYGPHFKEIGEAFGEFDLVMLDSGQYDSRWPYIHMTPEEAVQAADDLHAKVLLPMHIGKFSISRHTWNEPFIRITEASQNQKCQLITPMIGQPIWLDEQKLNFSHWWKYLN